MTDAEILGAAASILRRRSGYRSEICDTCGHDRADHLGTFEGVKIGCVGGYGTCIDPEDGIGCMRFKGVWVTDAELVPIIAALERAAMATPT